MASGGVQDETVRGRFAIETIFQPAPGSAPQFSRLEPEPDAAGDLRQYLRGGSAPSAVRAKRIADEEDVYKRQHEARALQGIGRDESFHPHPEKFLTPRGAHFRHIHVDP